MDAQDIHNLQEAYMEVVQNQQLDELTPATPRNIRRLVKKRKEDAKRAEDRTGHNFTPEYKKYFQTTQRQKVTDIFSRPSSRPRSAEPASTNEQTDLYDIILSHLLDEGYAETPEAAEAIMVNMGEGWRESILTESSHLEPDMKKRRKENEKAIEYIKNTKAHKDMVDTIRKKFDEEYVDEALRPRKERMARMVTPAKKKEQERTRKGRAILADIQATERALNEPKTPKSNKPTYDTPAAEVRKLKPKQKTDTLAVRAGRVLRDT